MKYLFIVSFLLVCGGVSAQTATIWCIPGSTTPNSPCTPVTPTTPVPTTSN